MFKFKMFCFSHAGGTVRHFYKWKRQQQFDIEIIPIELAGRGSRVKEPFYENMESAVQDLYNKIVKQIDETPYVILGHSMGGILAFEITKKIQQSAHNLPIFVIVSGRRPPHIIINQFPASHSEHDIKEILTNLKKIGGVPENLGNSSISELFLPVLKADLELIQTYDYYLNNIKLNAPLLILYANNDPLTKEKHIEEWDCYTIKSCEFIEFEGDHFFIYKERDKVLGLVSEKFANLWRDNIMN
ncbi:thioesterase II family protein [Bacillus wiedmannii]|uniref:thioesterase II family protein n=1 Tax=Bacillus wiedmannii TaxID=1890302 RepID=UPI002E1C7D19|nr:thioesterase domain-containing protein [Bacillus wiedmannii]